MSEKEKELRNTFLEILDRYKGIVEHVKRAEDWKNPFRDVIGKQLPGLLEECAEIKRPYRVVGSYGKGRWTDVPWVAVFDERITTSAQKGVYIVYLFNTTTKEVFLTFEVASTEFIDNMASEGEQRKFVSPVRNHSPELKARLMERVTAIRRLVPDSYFNADAGIDSGSVGYDKGAVYYKRYKFSAFPNGEQLVEDLQRMIAIYARYHNVCERNQAVNPDKPSTNGVAVYSLGEEVKNEPLFEFDRPDGEEPQSGSGEVQPTTEIFVETPMPIAVKDAVAAIAAYIQAKGFSYDSGLIENFYLSLKSKPFVILAGTSGTGKTRLVKLFAEAIGAAFKLVPVRPDWSDSSDLFGHTDLNGQFVPGAVIDFLREARNNPDRPHFLCLDEMNLARVEYYLSDFLSVIETREFDENGRLTSDPLVGDDRYGTDEAARQTYGTLPFPGNLYVVGTVNMDESAFPFSKKVLDRANTIEFSYVDLMPSFTMIGQPAAPQQLPNSFLKTRYLLLTQCAAEEETVKKICTTLQSVNEILAKAEAHVGYRVRDEIVFYLLENKLAGNLLTEDEALDFAIMQKILPRLQGSSTAVRTMVASLFKVFAGPFDQCTGDTDAARMANYLSREDKTSQYPRSAQKTALMMRRFEEDGMTSYWL